MHDESGATNGLLSQELRVALADAQAEHGAAQDALQNAVCAFIDDLRRHGRTLEQSIDEVRAFVATLRSRDPAPGPPTSDDERTLNRMIQWCGDHWRSRDHLAAIDRA